MCLGALLALACGAPGSANDLGAQTIPGVKYETMNYRLEVFTAGHFALQVGGSWMPGCVCL